jgi:hypothetical protein
MFYGHLEYFMAIWYFYDHLVQFVLIWYIFPVLVSCTKKNLATLKKTRFNGEVEKVGPSDLSNEPFDAVR